MNPKIEPQQIHMQEEAAKSFTLEKTLRKHLSMNGSIYIQEMSMKGSSNKDSLGDEIIKLSKLIISVYKV